MLESVRQTAPDLVRVVRVLRYEAEALASHVRGKLSRQQRVLLRGLQDAQGLKLNIGSGSHRLEGWLHLDGVPSADIRVDLRRRLPLPDGCARLIYTEHFVDHLEYPHGVHRFFSECRRLLAPGGRLRVVVHDLRILAAAYLRDDRKFFESAGAPAPAVGASINHLARFNDHHRFMYDWQTLSDALRSAGFSNVEQSTHRGSSLPELQIDLDLPDRAIQSLYVEAS